MRKIFLIISLFLFIQCKAQKYSCPENTFAMHDPQKSDTTKQKVDKVNQQKIYEQNKKLNIINDSLKAVDDKFYEIEKMIEQKQKAK